MKLRLLLLTLLLAALTAQALPQEVNAPLGKDQVLDLVKFGLESGDLAKRIKERGIDFEPTDDYLATLRQAGAQEAVINALRETRPRPLTREQVGELVAGGVANQRAAMLVKKNGIDFVADERYLQTLRVAGGDDTLIAALREASAALTKVRENPKDGLKYVWIPPGTFMMGCSRGDSECHPDEKPSHQVTITKGFWIGQTDVTVAAYKQFAARTSRQMPSAPSGWANDRMPIMNVTWNEALDYCTWAGGRLPTEAEWEYAGRAGSTEARYGPLDEVAWYKANSGDQVHEVAQKRANGFKLFDMLGSVKNWVNDWYAEDYYASSPERDPQGPSKGVYRGLRGGAYVCDPERSSLSSRDRTSSAYSFYYIGFRCARERDIP